MQDEERTRLLNELMTTNTRLGHTHGGMWRCAVSRLFGVCVCLCRMDLHELMVFV
jgi:hypothetical protein